MKSEINSTSYTDPKPERINRHKWHYLFKEIPEVFIDNYRYYRQFGKTEWNRYLFPPSSFLLSGSRYLRKLQFDNSLASLRLWGFMLSESERLFRARQMGIRVVANMGDLGAIPPLVCSFPNTVSFYPDCFWWTPFLNESSVLFDEAKRLGIGENCCFVRAALGAYSKLAYFPKPDLNIGATGASCDDMSAVMQLVNRLGHDIHWFELPHRKQKQNWIDAEEFTRTNSHDTVYQTRLKPFLINEFKQLVAPLEETSGKPFSDKRLRDSIIRTNKLRYLIQDIKDLTFSAERSPLPALEIMNIEFMALTGYSDIDEAIDILSHLKETIQFRIENRLGVSEKNALRIMWVTPPADPLLLNYLEDLGGRIVGTEFLINQALFPLVENADPFDSLADGLINASLIGASKTRAEEIASIARKNDAEGVIMSNIFASSHCAMETGIIKDYIRTNLDIPVLYFDVIPPGKQQLQSQILNRMTAFMELLKERRRKINGKYTYSA